MSGRIFSPFNVGRFTILPEDHPLPAEETIPLILGKKGAFGSGEHETTVSCLEFLETLPDLAGTSLMDLGSGTGILAIAAIKLGAGRAVAIDIDPRAAESCSNNVRLNGLDEQISTVLGELSAVRGSFDLFIANIYADVHLALAGEMIRLTRPGGLLLLSGIPLQDNFEIKHAFTSRGASLLDSRYMEEYVTFLMKNG